MARRLPDEGQHDAEDHGPGHQAHQGRQERRLQPDARLRERATFTAVSRRTLLANRIQSSSVTTRPVATPRTVAVAGPPARSMPMGTHRSTRNRVPCRMPQAIEPNSHSPRNRNVPMAMSSSATTTIEIAARTSPMMMPRS